MTTDSKAASGKTVGPARQWLLCLLMCAAALAIVVCSGRDPRALLSGGLAMGTQFLVGLGLGAAACVSSLVGYKLTSHRATTQHTIQSYSRLSLSGWNPLWIALAAGVGEEMLFRGALQPITGIWLSSILFVLAHTQAYRFAALNKRTLAQACSLLAASLVLAVIARYIGLVAAAVLHTAIDVAGLYTVRYASAPRPTAA